MLFAKKSITLNPYPHGFGTLFNFKLNMCYYVFISLSMKTQNYPFFIKIEVK